MTDALQIQAQRGCVMAYKFKGRRFDCGSVPGFVEATNHVYEHYYAKENVYWMTWGGTFAPGEPKRVEERDVSPGGAPDTAVVSYQERIHKENDYSYDPRYTDDRWYWRYMAQGTGTFVNDFEVTNIVDGTGWLNVQAYGPYQDTEIKSADSAFRFSYRVVISESFSTFSDSSDFN